LCFHFHSIPGTFLFPPLFLLWPTDCWAMCCSASNCLSIFCCYFCWWVVVLLHCDQIVCRGLFQFSYICWDLLCLNKDMIYFGESFMGCSEKCVFCCCRMEYSVDICQFYQLYDVI
jgi:hypothetical protein